MKIAVSVEGLTGKLGQRAFRWRLDEQTRLIAAQRALARGERLKTDPAATVPALSDVPAQ